MDIVAVIMPVMKKVTRMKGGEGGGGQEGDPTGRRDDENGNFSGGASNAGDDGDSRPVDAEDFLGIEFAGGGGCLCCIQDVC
ncbi:hypothetical protein AHAS_Ahas10G0069000 [Arachis hypogaea]